MSHRTGLAHTVWTSSSRWSLTTYFCTGKCLVYQMDDVKMDFRAEQYEQALSLKDSIAALANWQIFFPYRPKATPRQDPKAWWRYAVAETNKRMRHSVMQTYSA